MALIVENGELTEGFILTMWNVNLVFLNSSLSISCGFILTMWNVN